MTPKSSMILDLLSAGIAALAACEKCQEKMADAAGDLPPLVDSSGRRVVLPWIGVLYGDYGGGASNDDYSGSSVGRF